MLFSCHQIQDINGQICGGGVSVYYSHVLKVLLISYAQGKSFVAFLRSVCEGTSHLYEIVLSSNSKNGLNSSSKTSGSSASQPLCQWTEVPSHPGLICCMVQSSKFLKHFRVFLYDRNDLRLTLDVFCRSR